MTIKHWSAYRTDDGMFVGRVVGGSTPGFSPSIDIPGCSFIEGRHDHLSKRVDLTTMTVVDYQPAAPDPDHEWDVKTRRWRKSRAALEREGRALDLQTQIDRLETLQARPLRELALNPLDPAARTRVLDINTQISALRQQRTR